MVNAVIDSCMECLGGMQLSQTEQPERNSIEVIPGFFLLVDEEILIKQRGLGKKKGRLDRDREKILKKTP